MLIAWLLMAALQSMVALGSFNGSATNGSSSGSNYPDPPMYIDPGGPTGPVEPLKNRFKNYQYDPPPYDLVISTDRFCRQINCPGLDETANLPCAKAEQNAECITRNAESQDQFIQDVAAEMFDCQRNEANPDTNLIDVEDHLRESYAEILNNSVRCGWWGALQSQQISESLVVDAITRAQILCEEAKHLDVTGYEEEQLVNDCINEVWGRTQMIMDDDETEYVSYLLSPLGLSDPHPKHEEIYDFAFPLLAINSDLDKSQALNSTLHFLPRCLDMYGLVDSGSSPQGNPNEWQSPGGGGALEKPQFSSESPINGNQLPAMSVMVPVNESSPSYLQGKIEENDKKLQSLKNQIAKQEQANAKIGHGNVFGLDYKNYKLDAIHCAYGFFKEANKDISLYEENAGGEDYEDTRSEKSSAENPRLSGDNISRIIIYAICVIKAIINLI